MRKRFHGMQAFLLAVIMMITILPAAVYGSDVIFGYGYDYEEGYGYDDAAQGYLLEVNGKGYQTFAEALKAAGSSGVIRLKGDISLTHPIHIKGEWGTTLTLDLNGYTIRLYGAGEDAPRDDSGVKKGSEGGVFIIDSGTLLIKDSFVNEGGYAGTISSSNKKQPIFLQVYDYYTENHLQIMHGFFSAAKKQPVIRIKDAYGTEIQEVLFQMGAMPFVSAQITGGKFNKRQPEIYLAGGCTQADAGDGYWEVTQQQVQPVSGHTIHWRNWDNTLLETDTVRDGELPVYNGSTPVRQEDAEYTYRFAGWLPQVKPAYADTTYLADYTREAKTDACSVTWLNSDGSWLATSTVEKGGIPRYPGPYPTRSDDANFYYIFTGWSPEIGPVGSDTVYMAVYRAVPR